MTTDYQTWLKGYTANKDIEAAYNKTCSPHFSLETANTGFAITMRSTTPADVRSVEEIRAALRGKVGTNTLHCVMAILNIPTDPEPVKVRGGELVRNNICKPPSMRIVRDEQVTGDGHVDVYTSEARLRDNGAIAYEGLPATWLEVYRDGKWLPVGGFEG